jgi:lipopolysaccharide export system protein LptA
LKWTWAAAALIWLAAPLLTAPAAAQQLDLSHGGPIDITARDGIEWRQVEQEVIARGDAKAIRGNVTVTADRLTAWYRKKAGTQTVQATPVSGLTGDPSTAGNEIYRLQADGNVVIFTSTDRAQGDKATYDLDQSVLVMTGRDLKLTTPTDVITAKDDLEYWPQRHMAVARGDAVVVTNDAKRIAADTLVAYTTDNPPPAPVNSPPGSSATASSTPGTPTATAAKPSEDPLASSGKLQRVEAFGHVSVRTPTDIVTGDRGVYVLDTGMARLGGNVHITRGQNQLNGAEADVNMKTGIATLVAQKAGAGQKAGRVHGLVVPNDESNKSLGVPSAMTPGGGTAKAPAANAASPTAAGQQP